MGKYQYEIFQTNARQEFAFMSWDIATKHGWSFDSYKFVWNGDDEARDDLDLLEHLYEVFNEHRPSEFKRHSLSVSDIVSVYGENDIEPTYYYCNSYGWANITADVVAWLGLNEKEVV